MEIVYYLLLALLFLAVVIGPLLFLYVRKQLREQKNYERGLKMVPLFIHLPPPSDDKESGARDEREINDEVISKAQILYSIIASTVQKGMKHKFYGQRHFSFEIIGSYGSVRFYAAVPVALVDVVSQAIISAYPNARLEEVAEHNIFSPVGNLSGTVGGELTLKESFAYPIATYQDIKRDPMQTILNALSGLEKEDGVGIQILLRPAESSWRKRASAIASKKRKGNGGKSGGELGLWTKQFASAFWKAPEDKKKDGGKDGAELSSLEQNILDAIDDKTRHPGYETLIRVVASSNVSQRAQTVLNQVVAAFSLFDAPGKNGFKYTPARDIENFVTGYILRFFPQDSSSNILNVVELAGIFHFPDQRNIPTTQLERQQSKQVDAPRNMPQDGLFMGYNIFRGVKRPIRISFGDRQRHMYAVGQTGTGKSTFMENLALQDMLNGDGFAYIDPHGDGAEKLLAMVPKERTEDVIYFCPFDMEYPLGLNIFEYQNPDQKDFLIQECINMLYKLYDPQRQGIIGPRYESMFRNLALTIMADPNGGTFIDIPKLFTSEAFVKEKLKYVTDQNVLDFWLKEIPASQRSSEFGEVKAWVVSKFGAFLSNEMMRNIIGQTKSSFNLRDVMDNKKILIVNLSKGKTGDLNSKLLGMIFVMKFQAAAMSRADIPEHDRVPFCLYVDEFQNFSTDSFATIMSEARKFNLNLIVANQFTTQLTEEIRDAVFGNIGTVVAFRIGQNDMEILSKYFQPLFDADDLLRVPNHNAVVRTLVGGVPTTPFSMATVPPLGTPNPKLADALKQLSAAKFGKPRKQVSDEIFTRLRPKEEEKPLQQPFKGPGMPFATQSSPNYGQPIQRSPVAAMGPTQAQGNTFLNQWLIKKQQAVSAPRPPLPPSAVAQNTQNIQAANPVAGSAPVITVPKNNPTALHPSTTISDQQDETKEHNVIDLQSQPSGSENTIFIDQEGNLSNSQTT